MNIPSVIAEHLGVHPKQVASTIELLDAGNTVPFIARYRKEATGVLDEEQIRQISVLVERERRLQKRRETIIDTIRSQDKLTPELSGRIINARSLAELEDLYNPYRPRRRTRASIARERGLQQLADTIQAQPITRQSVNDLARPYLSETVPTIEEALDGARDIVAEEVSEHAGVRAAIRERALRSGVLTSGLAQGATDERSTYRLYHSFEQRVDRVRPHQILALRRGERDKVLTVKLSIAEREWREAITAAFPVNPRSVLSEQLRLAIDDGVARLLLPAIERDVRRITNEQADTHAIDVFAANLRGLLTQPPLSGHVVLGIDPGYRTGCKVAVVDQTGKVLDTATIYPHAPHNEWEGALDQLAGLVARHQVSLLAIGNGTASQESASLAADLISRQGDRGDLAYLVVSEAGASVYSASSLARAELPDLDVSLRGAVSIARRVQDPLAELVKIDPKSIGVGMYQHDVDQKELASALHSTVEGVVNAVGVELNTASAALLGRVAGIGPKLAESIVAYRDSQGPFPNRMALQRVPGLGPKAFEQAAGFLRVRDSTEPLDHTAIHPESYAAAREALARAGLTAVSPLSERKAGLARLLGRQSFRELAADIGVGTPTLQDILEQLLRPGRDPRESLPRPAVRTDVLSMDDLAPGMQLIGTVRNVVDFGAFVDIGVKHDGLLHRSQIPRGLHLTIGELVDVVIKGIDVERGRIGLGWVGRSGAGTDQI
ncbi:MAG: RNA-binding transcriptional accessory protein [Chloroflexi bacterium]|nr:RNA-binding transcriptional accessory protein [Chloroflexota bacterium]